MQIFISYKSENRPFALRLRDQLRAWGYSTWLDVDNVSSGASWLDAITDGLQTSDVVVGVMTPLATHSNMVKAEWAWALQHKKTFVPVLLEPCEVLYPFNILNYIRFVEDEAAGYKQLRAAIENPIDPSPPDLPPTKSDRVDSQARMLQKVHDFWIKGVLVPSKIGDVWLDLPAAQRPEAVQPEIKRDLRNPDFDTFTLGTEKSIAEVFHRLGRELLILGAPGSGKTMTLLELAKDLLAQAQANSSKPIPVVFNLASWAEHCPEKLEDWLTERLFMEYGVPHKLAIEWIANGKLLFLLDGLDEVKVEQRDTCVTAINIFWQRYDQVDNGIVVCSRIADYELLVGRLCFENAIQLQTLTSEQADLYLAQLGTEWSELRAILPSDPVLHQMSESPLLLNIMAMAYRDTPREQIVGLSEDDQKRQVFKRYVDRCLHKDNDQTRYTHPKTRHYLSWLARKMVEHDLIVFHIEELQPDWLEAKQQRDEYPKKIKSSFKSVFSLLYGLLLGLDVGLVILLIVGLGVGPKQGVVYGLIGAFLGMVFGIMLFGVLGGELYFRFHEKTTLTRINTAEKLVWTWLGIRDIVRAGLRHGLIEGSVGGLIMGLTIGIIAGWKLGFADGVLLGSVGGLFFGFSLGAGILLSTGLNVGLQGRAVDLRTQPNQGIRRSIMSGITVSAPAGCVFVVGAGVVFGLIFLLAAWLVSGSGFGIFAGLIGGFLCGPASGVIMGLNAGLDYGWRSVIHHAVLRRMLAIADKAPENYAEFLRYTSSRHLTRQVGGGFIFRHRMLMEYFAEMEK